MSEEIQRVEVITSVQRRRRWSVAEKIRLVGDMLQPGISVSFVARKHGLRRACCSNGGSGWPQAAARRSASTTR
jgi:transposase-like protein